MSRTLLRDDCEPFSAPWLTNHRPGLFGSSPTLGIGLRPIHTTEQKHPVPVSSWKTSATAIGASANTRRYSTREPTHGSSPDGWPKFSGSAATLKHSSAVQSPAASSPPQGARPGRVAEGHRHRPGRGRPRRQSRAVRRTRCELTYHHEGRITVQMKPRGIKVRVGGATCTITPRGSPAGEFPSAA